MKELEDLRKIPDRDICAGWIIQDGADCHETYIERLELGQMVDWCHIHECDAWLCFADPIK